MIVINGDEVSRISMKDLEVDNRRQTWNMKNRQHEFDAGGYASHVIYLTTTRGKRLSVARKL